MSALRAVEGGRKSKPKGCRSVELAKRKEADAWALADAVFDDVLDRLPEGEGMPSPSGVKTGLFAAESEVAAEHERAGTEVSRSYLHNLFVTRRVWPPDERVPEIASFDAHFELRGSDWRNRRQILERLASKSKTGRVSRRQVVIYKSERKPVQMRTFLQLVDQRVRASLRAAAAPWHTVAQGDRESIASLLRDVAREVEDGTFPKP